MKTKKLIIWTLVMLTIVELVIAGPNVFLDFYNGTFYEDFETGTFVTNNWTVITQTDAWTVSGDSPPEGSNAARLIGGSGVEEYLQLNISTEFYVNITISNFLRTQGIELPDYFRVDWWNGSGWNLLQLVNGTNVDSVQYNYTLGFSRWVDGSYSGENEDFILRYACNNNQAVEKCHVDVVNITGIPNCHPELDVDWNITYPEYCDNRSVSTGTGKINILEGGSLTLLNGALVNTTELLIDRQGDSVFINRGTELIIK